MASKIGSPSTPTVVLPPSPLISPRTPGSLEHSAGMKFPSRQRVVIAHLSMRLVKLVACPASLEGLRLCISWKWGSKETNRGFSEPFTVTNGSALVVHSFQVVSSFLQQMPAKVTEPNRMLIALHLVKSGAKELLASRSIDMAQFCTDRSEKTKSFALDKRDPAMSVTLSVETTWLKIDGKKVVDHVPMTALCGAAVDNMDLASPTAFPGVAPRSSAGRASMVSPVVMHQAMKEGQRAKVLETAKTPNPTLDKMMEAERQFVRKQPSPVKKEAPKDVSPRKQKSVPGASGAAASPPGHGSPFFRRKDTPAPQSPVVVRLPEKDVGRPKTAIFGFALSRAMELQRETHPDLGLPYVVHYLCSQVLVLGGQRSEGIFRISVNSDDLDLFSKNFDRGNYKLPPKDPNYPAVLLKHYLRNLPEPLCPDYGRCLEAAHSDELVGEVFFSLPTVTQNVIKYLSNFICLLGDAKYVAQTKMEVTALCIVFTPATLKNPVFDYASAIKNQSIEQAFMQRLVLWTRAKFPDDTVAGFSPSTSPPTPVAIAAPERPQRPQRRVSGASNVSGGSQSPPQLKKRLSALPEEMQAPPEESSPGKSRKTGKNVSPSNSMQRLPPRPK